MNFFHSPKISMTNYRYQDLLYAKMLHSDVKSSKVPTVQSCKRFPKKEGCSWCYDVCCDAITVKVDRPIILAGYGLYGARAHYNIFNSAL